MKNYIEFPCLSLNTPPKIYLEHLLQRLYNADNRAENYS